MASAIHNPALLSSRFGELNGRTVLVHPHRRAKLQSSTDCCQAHSFERTCANPGERKHSLVVALKRNLLRSDLNSSVQRDRALTLHTFAFNSDSHWLDKSSVRDDDVNEEVGIDLSAHLREKDYPPDLRRRPGEGLPLTDANARRLVKMRETWERSLRRRCGPNTVPINRWFKRTPDEMEKFLADGRWQFRWNQRCV